MKNRIITCILPLIIAAMVINSFALADIGGVDPGVDDPFGSDPTTVTTITTTTKSSDTSSTDKEESSTKKDDFTNAINSTIIYDVSKISSFKATFVRVNSVKLSWSKVPGATSYRIIRAVEKGKFVTYKTVKSNSFTNKKLKRGKKYRYIICALKSNKIICCSEPKTVKVLAKKVGKVKTSVTKKYVKLTIKSTCGAARYEVKYSTNKKLKSAKKITSKNPQLIIKKLKKNKKYYAKVRVYKIISGKKVYTKAKTISFKTK